MGGMDIKAVEGVERDSGHVSESDEVLDFVENEKTGEIEPYKVEIVWQNVGKFVVLHSLFLYSLTYMPSMSLKMWMFLAFTTQYSGAGITGLTTSAVRRWETRTTPSVDSSLPTWVG